MSIQSYLFFEGRCDEALQFYKGAIGADVQMLMRYKEAPNFPPPESVPSGTENKVMHATFRVGDTLVMASDGHCGGKANFEGFALALQLPAVAEVDRAFAALGDGGKVDMPLDKTFWSPRFGMLTDRFGVRWMISVAA